MALLDEARDKLRVGTRQILQLVTQPPVSDTNATLRRAKSNLEELLGEFRRAAVVTQTAAIAMHHTNTPGDQSAAPPLPSLSPRKTNNTNITTILPAIVNKTTPPPSASLSQPGMQKKGPQRHKNIPALAASSAAMAFAASVDEPRVDDMAVHPLPFIHTSLTSAATAAPAAATTKAGKAARTDRKAAAVQQQQQQTQTRKTRAAATLAGTPVAANTNTPASSPSSTSAASVPMLTAMLVYVEECQIQAALLLESQQALDTAELLLATAEAEMAPLRVIAERLVCPALQELTTWVNASSIAEDTNHNADDLVIAQDNTGAAADAGKGEEEGAAAAGRERRSKFGKLLKQHSAEAKAAPRRVLCGFVPDEAELPLALRAFLRVVQQAMLRLVGNFYRGLATDPQADDAAALFRTTLTCLDRLVQLVQTVVSTPTFLVEPVPVSCLLKPSRTAPSSHVPPSPPTPLVVQHQQQALSAPQWQLVGMSPSERVAGLSVGALCAVPHAALARERNNSSSNKKKKRKTSEEGAQGPWLYRVPDLAYHVVFSATVYVYDLCHALLKCVHSRYGSATMAAPSPFAAAEGNTNIGSNANNSTQAAVAALGEPGEDTASVFAGREAEPLGPAAVYRHCIRALGTCLNVCEGSVKSFLVLATVKYLPWRVQLYELIAQCYEETQSYAEAWQVAQRAEQRLRELVELQCYAPSAVPAARQRTLLQAMQRMTLLKLKYGWYQAIALRMQQQQQQQQRARSTTFMSGTDVHADGGAEAEGGGGGGNGSSNNVAQPGSTSAQAAHYTTNATNDTADGSAATGLMADLVAVDLPRSGKELLQRMVQQLQRAQQPVAQALAQVGSRSTLANDPSAGLAAKPVSLAAAATTGGGGEKNARPTSAGAAAAAAAAAAEAALRERLARESCEQWLPFLLSLLTPRTPSPPHSTSTQDGTGEGRAASLLQTAGAAAGTGVSGGLAQRTRLGGTSAAMNEASETQTHHAHSFAGLRSCALEALQWCFQRLATAYVADKACRKALTSDATLYPFPTSSTTQDDAEEGDGEDAAARGQKAGDEEVAEAGQEASRVGQGSAHTRTASRKASRPSSQGKSGGTTAAAAANGSAANATRSRSVTTRHNAAGSATRAGSARRGGPSGAAAAAQAAHAAVTEEALLAKLLSLRHICPNVWALLALNKAEAAGLKAHVVQDDKEEEEEGDERDAGQASRVRLPRSKTERAQAELLLLLQCYYQLYNASSSTLYLATGAMLRHVVQRVQSVQPSLAVLLELVATTVRLLQQLRYAHVLQRFLALVLSSDALPPSAPRETSREGIGMNAHKRVLSGEEVYLVQAGVAAAADLQGCLHHSQVYIAPGSSKEEESNEKSAAVQGGGNNININAVEAADKNSAATATTKAGGAAMTVAALLTMYNETSAMSRFMLALLSAARTLQQVQALLDRPTSAAPAQPQTRRASSLQVSLSRLVFAQPTTMYSTANKEDEGDKEEEDRGGEGNAHNNSNSSSAGAVSGAGWREMPWAYAALYERVLYHVSFYLVHHAALWPELKARLSFAAETPRTATCSATCTSSAERKEGEEDAHAASEAKSAARTAAPPTMTADAAEQAYLHVMTYAMAGLQRSGRAPVHLVSGIAMQLAEHVLHDLQHCLTQAAERHALSTTTTTNGSSSSTSVTLRSRDAGTLVASSPDMRPALPSWQAMRLVAERGMLANSLVSVALRLVVQRQAALRHILQRPKASLAQHPRISQGSNSSRTMEAMGEAGKTARSARGQSRARRPQSGGRTSKNAVSEDTEGAVVYRRAAQLCDTRTALTRTAVLLRHHVAQVRQLLQQHAQRQEDIRVLAARQASTLIYGLATAKEVRLLRTLQAEEALQPDEDEDHTARHKSKDGTTTTTTNAAAGNAEDDVFALLTGEVTAGTTAAADEEARLLNWSYKHPLLRVLVLLCLAGSTMGSSSSSGGNGATDLAAAARTRRDRLQEAVRLLQKEHAVLDAFAGTSPSLTRPSSPRAARLPSSLCSSANHAHAGHGVQAALQCLAAQYSPVMLWSYAASTCARLRLRGLAATPRYTLDGHFTEKQTHSEPKDDNNNNSSVVGHTRYLLHELVLRPRLQALHDSSVERLLTLCRAMLDLSGLELSCSATSHNNSTSSMTPAEGDETRRGRLGRYGQQRVGLACAYRALFVMHTLQHLQQKLMSSSDEAAVMMLRASGNQGSSSGSSSSSGGGSASRPASAVSSLVLQCAAQMLNSLLPVLHGAQASLCIYAVQPLMAICYALLTTSSQNTIWHDAGLQLIAARTVSYLRQTLLQLGALQPLPHRTDAGTVLYASVQQQLPALYKLLFATFVHAWNAVYSHPCDRQAQYKAYVIARSTYSRRVLGQRLHGCGANNAAEGGSNSNNNEGAAQGAGSHERTHAANARGRGGAAAAGGGRSAAGNKAHASEANAAGSGRGEAAAAAAAADPSAQATTTGLAGAEGNADFFGAAYVAEGTEAAAQSASCALYDAMPVEYLELFEQLLFLTPHGAQALLRPGSTTNTNGGASPVGSGRRGEGTTATAGTAGGGHHASLASTVRATSSVAGANASRAGGNATSFALGFALGAESEARPQSPSQCVEAGEDMWACVDHMLAEASLRGVPPILHEVSAALALAEHGAAASPSSSSSPNTNAEKENNNTNTNSTGSHVAAAIAALEQLVRQPRCQDDPLFAKVAVRSVEYCVYYGDHAAAQRLASWALEVLQKQGLSWQSYVATLMQQLRSWCTRNGFTVEDFAVGNASSGANNNNSNNTNTNASGVGGASVTALSTDGAESQNEQADTSAVKEEDTRRRAAKERNTKTGVSIVKEASNAGPAPHDSPGHGSYIALERSWTRLEQYTLRQLTRAMAWYRRRRALRWLHARLVQFTRGCQAMLELHLACAARHDWAALQHAQGNGGARMMSCEDGLVRPSSAHSVSATASAAALHSKANSRSSSPSLATATTAAAQSRAGRRTADTQGTAANASAAADEQTLSCNLVQHAARAATLFNVCQLPGWAVRAVQTALEPLREQLGPAMPDIFYYSREAEEVFGVMLQQQQGQADDEAGGNARQQQQQQYANAGAVSNNNNNNIEPAARTTRADSNTSDNSSSSNSSDGGMAAMQRASQALPEETLAQLKALQPWLVQLTRELLAALALARDDYCSAQHGLELALQPGALKTGQFVKQAGQLRFAGHVPSLQVRLSELGQAEQRRGEQRRAALRVRAGRFVRWQLQQCADLERDTRALAEADAQAALYAMVCTAAEELPALRPWRAQLRPRGSGKAGAEPSFVAPQTATGTTNGTLAAATAVGKAAAPQGMAASMRTTDTAGRQLGQAGTHLARRNKAAHHVVNKAGSDAAGDSALAALYSLSYALYVPGRPSRVKAVAAVREGRSTNTTMSDAQGTMNGAAHLAGRDDDGEARDNASPLLYVSADTSETSVMEALLYVLRCLQYANPRLCLRLCMAAHRVTGGRYGLELLPLALGLRAVQSNAEYEHLRRLCVASCRATGRQQRLLCAARRRWERYTLTQRYAEVCDTSPLYGTRALLHRLLLATASQAQSIAAKVEAAQHKSYHALLPASASAPPFVFEGGAEELRLTLQAYQSAVNYLKAKRSFVSLGLCLLELGHIRLRHNALDEAERCWLDAVDALTEVPTCLRVWRAFASSSSPSSPSEAARSNARNGVSCDVQSLGLARVLYCTTALGSLAMYVYHSHQQQAMEACLLAATLLAQYLQCNAVSVNMPVCCIDVMDGLFADLEDSELAAYLCAGSSSGAAASAAAEEERAWCGHAGHVVHTLLYMSQQLLEYDYNAYAGLLAVLAEAIAHRRTASVTLVVEARLLRAKAAMRVGNVCAALQLLVTVCQGAQLPNAAYHLLQPTSLPAFAVVHIAGRPSTGGSASQDKRGAKTQQAGPQVQGGNADAGRGSGYSERVGTLSYDNAALPTSERNIAALQAFVQDCFPALYTRTSSATATTSTTAPAAAGHTSSSSSAAAAANSHAGAVGGLHEAVAAFYGDRLARRVVLCAAQVLVELGSCDAAYLWLTAYPLPHAPCGSGALTRMNSDGEAHGQAADLLANILAGGSAAAYNSNAGGARSRPGSRDVSLTRGRGEADGARRANAASGGAGANSSAGAGNTAAAAATAGGASGKDNSSGNNANAAAGTTTVCTEALRVAELLLQDLLGEGSGEEEAGLATGKAGGAGGSNASGGHNNNSSRNKAARSATAAGTQGSNARRKKELAGREEGEKQGHATLDAAATVAALEHWIESEAAAALTHRVVLCKAWLATAQGNSREALALLDGQVIAYNHEEDKDKATTIMITDSNTPDNKTQAGVRAARTHTVALSSATSESAVIAAAAAMKATSSNNTNSSAQMTRSLDVGRGFHVSLVPEVPSFLLSLSHTHWCAVQQCRAMNYLRQRDLAAAAAAVQQGLQLCALCEDSYHGRRFRMYEAVMLSLQGSPQTRGAPQAVRNALAELRRTTQALHPGPADPYDAWVALALTRLSACTPTAPHAVSPYESNTTSNSTSAVSVAESDAHEAALREVIAMLVSHAAFHGYTTLSEAITSPSCNDALQGACVTAQGQTSRAANAVPRSLAWGAAVAVRLHAALNAFAQHKFISCPVFTAAATTSSSSSNAMDGEDARLRVRWQEGMTALHRGLAQVALWYDTQAHPTCVIESKLLLARALLRLPRTTSSSSSSSSSLSYSSSPPTSASRRTQRGASQLLPLLPPWCSALGELSPVQEQTSLPALLQPSSSSSSSAWSQRARAAVDTLPSVSERCAATLLLQVLEACVADGTHDHGTLRLALLELAGVFARAAQDKTRRVRRSTTHTSRAEGDKIDETDDKTAAVAKLQSIVAASCTTLALLVCDMAHHVTSHTNAFADYAEDESTLSSRSALLQRHHLPDCLVRAVQVTRNATGYLDAASQPRSRYAAPAVSTFYEEAEGNAQPGGFGAGRQRSLSSAGSGGGGTTREGLRRGSGRPSSPPPQAMTNNYTSTGTGQVVTVQEVAHCYGILHREQRQAYDLLLPSDDALAQELTLKLLRRYLQDYTVPPSCTYLCYSGEQRRWQRWQLGGPQALRTAMTALLAAHSTGSGGWSAAAQGAGGNTSARRGGGGGASTVGGAANNPLGGGSSNTGNNSNAAGAQATQQMQDTVDLWNATLPPLMLASLPAQLCTTAGMDELAAPQVNTVLAQSFVSAASAPLLWSLASTTDHTESNNSSSNNNNRRSTRQGTRRTNAALTSVTAVLDGDEATMRVTLLAAIAPQNDAALTAPPSLGVVAERNRQLRQRTLVQYQQQLAFLQQQQQQQAAQLQSFSHRGNTSSMSGAEAGISTGGSNNKRRPSSRSPSSNGSPLGRTGHRVTGGSLTLSGLAAMPQRHIPPISINAALHDQQASPLQQTPSLPQDTRSAASAARNTDAHTTGNSEEGDAATQWTCLCVTLPLSTVQSLRQQAEKLRHYLRHSEAEEDSNGAVSCTTPTTQGHTHSNSKNSPKSHDSSAHAMFGSNLRNGGTATTAAAATAATTVTSSARHTQLDATGNTNNNNNSSAAVMSSASAGMTLHGVGNAVLAAATLSPFTRPRSAGYGGQQLAQALAEASAALQNRGTAANAFQPQLPLQQGMLTSASLAVMGNANMSSGSNAMNAAATMRARTAQGGLSAGNNNNTTNNISSTITSAVNGGSNGAATGAAHHGGLSGSAAAMAAAGSAGRLNSTTSGMTAAGASSAGRNGTNSNSILTQGRTGNGVDMCYKLRNSWMLETDGEGSTGVTSSDMWSRETDEAKATFVLHLVESIVRASATAAVLSSEARVEACVSALLPRCRITEPIANFFVDWLSEEKGSAGRFFDPGLHEWLQRLQRFVAAPEAHEGNGM